MPATVALIVFFHYSFKAVMLLQCYEKTKKPNEAKSLMWASILSDFISNIAGWTNAFMGSMAKSHLLW